MSDALDLDHSYCARCETYIWPEKRQVEVQVPAKPAPASSSKPAATVTKLRTVISLDRAPLYCSPQCRQSDLESGSANARRIMEHFQPSPTSPCASPTHDRARANSDYFARIARGLPWARRSSATSTRSLSSIELLEEHRQWSRQLLAESADRLSRSSSRAAISAESTTLPKPKPKPELKPRDDDDETPAAIPFSHRRWKEQQQGPRPTPADRTVEVDVAALYDSYPMSQRVRSTSSFGSSSSVRPGSMSASTVSDTASIRTTSSRGSTHRQYAGLSAESTRGLLVPTAMLRSECDSPVYSTHSVSDDGEEPEGYFSISRNRTITQRTHAQSKSASSPKSRRPKADRSQKTIQELVREAGGPEYGSRSSARPLSWSLSDREHVGPLYEVTRTPPGPVKRHVVHEVDVDGKTELQIVEEDHWEAPQKLFHFMV